MIEEALIGRLHGTDLSFDLHLLLVSDGYDFHSIYELFDPSD